MTANDLDRRAFLRTAASGGALLLAGSGFRLASPRGQDALRIAFVMDEDDAAIRAARGVTLGVEEAARTGEMLGRTIQLATLGSAAATGVLARAEPVAALMGGFGEAACGALGETASSLAALFVNVGCGADALRGECRPHVFHVQASARMYADALAARSGDAANAVEAVLWHPSLERFGAAQLNDRFRARFGMGMDGAAWAGWMAVKVLWEASLRARTVEAAGIRDYLAREATQFDGHKGWPLSFRAWDHQLRQPLDLVADGGARVVGEVPARAADGGASSRELLDRLGTSASTSACAAAGGQDAGSE
jgi:ABC-type branched-subunit amino acid transport system substrate-binding protein